ncbi:MAG: MBL fold metallo-hydrolase [Armatimonadetes bacterium]|nr:MBL fold metallo-hydrolase [Anaerolineae bacterium]
MSQSAALEIIVLTLGIVATNCYIIGDKATGNALLIDPVDDAPLLVQTAAQAGFTIKLILATHGHFDHVLASADLKTLTGAPFYINQRDAGFLERLPETGLRYTGERFPEAGVPDRWLTDVPEVLTLDGIRLETLFTPGHAPGHLCFYLRDHGIVFGGDALFMGSIGRTDLPGSDTATLMHSIFDVLLPLGDDIRLLPGHGPETTLGRERRTNPFLRRD